MVDVSGDISNFLILTVNTVPLVSLTTHLQNLVDLRRYFNNQDSKRFIISVGNRFDDCFHGDGAAAAPWSYGRIKSIIPERRT